MINRVWALILLPIAAVELYGQGKVIFANRVAPGGSVVNAPVVKYSSTNYQRGPGPDWSAQLFLKDGAELTPLLPTSTFRPLGQSATADQYWVSQTNTVPGVPPGQPATFVVRAWKSSFGSYEAAALEGYVGESEPVTITLGDDAQPAPLTGLQVFTVGPFAPRLRMVLRSGRMEFRIATVSRYPNTLEVSSDLINWQPYLTLYSFVDSFVIRDSLAAATNRARFYRFRSGEGYGFTRDQWWAENFKRYQFTFTRNSTLKPAEVTARLTVQRLADGVWNIIEARDVVVDGQAQIQPPTREYFKAIEDLFQLVDANSLYEVLAVAYDEDLRYPKFVYSKGVQNGSAVEMTLTATDVQALP